MLQVPKIESEAEIRSGVTFFTGKEVVQNTSCGHFDKNRPLPDGLTTLLAGAKSAPIKAVDIETTALRPYGNGKILSVAISYDDHNFSFALDHPQAGWTDHQKNLLWDWLADVLPDDTIKIAHNAPFECEWFIEELSFDCIRHEAWEDTMLQAHFLDERPRGLSLDFLCRMHFGTAYKDFFMLDKKDMVASDLNEMLTYNAVDTKLTLRLWHLQNKLLKEQDLYDAYQTARERQPTVAIMQHLGMDVDQAVVKQYQLNTSVELDAINRDIQAVEVVTRYVKDTGKFNPLGKDAIVIFRDYLKRKEIEVKEEGMALRWSIDKNVLSKIDHPLADLIVRLRHLTKLKSTYIDCLELGVGDDIHPDGKIHTSFNTCFTETGRTSSNSPNMQNFPKRADSWVRSQIVPPLGSYLVAFDYGQLEICTAAMLSKDAYLVKALWEDHDIHMEFAGRLAKIYPKICPNFSDPKEAKKLRTQVKGALVFASLYGAASQKVSDGLGIPLEIAEQLQEGFWRSLRGHKAWQDRLMKEYYATGYVPTPTGRRRRYPLTQEQAVNFPLQCLASEIVCNGMVRLSKEASKTRRWYLHPRLNIHDDLTFCIPKEDAVLTDAIRTIYRIMLTPQFGDLINVPLSVTASLGHNWDALTEIGKFWSHKDV